MRTFQAVFHARRRHAPHQVQRRQEPFVTHNDSDTEGGRGGERARERRFARPKEEGRKQTRRTQTVTVGNQQRPQKSQPGTGRMREAALCSVL